MPQMFHSIFQTILPPTLFIIFVGHCLMFCGHCLRFSNISLSFCSIFHCHSANVSYYSLQGEKYTTHANSNEFQDVIFSISQTETLTNP